MNFQQLMMQAGHLPVLDTEILLAGVWKPNAVKVQISRWCRAGKLVKLRRGLYLFAEPYRKTDVYEPYLASILEKPSYLSMGKALEYHDLIPEAVSIYTSVTTKRPGRFVTAAGTFDYKHIQPALFWGFESVTMNQQTGFVATPEKAILDFVYFHAGPISDDYIKEMRFQQLEKINLKKLLVDAEKFRKPKIIHSAKMIIQYIRRTAKGEKSL